MDYDVSALSQLPNARAFGLPSSARHSDDTAVPFVSHLCHDSGHRAEHAFFDDGQLSVGDDDGKV